MAVVLRMPEVLANATEAVVANWVVAVGDSFAVGDTLAEIETEKALVDLTAEEAGILGRVIAGAGQSTAVGAPIAVVISAGESEADIDLILGAEAVEPARTLDPAIDTPTAVVIAAVAASPVAERGGRTFASPLARRLARDNKLDVGSLEGTGPNGRIVRRDVEEALTASAPDAARAVMPRPPAPTPVSAGSAEFTEIPHTAMRRAIARRLTESKSTVPHFYLTADCAVDELLELRRKMNLLPNVRISVNDFVIKAVATAFEEVPEANVIWTDAALRQFTRCDIGVAVATDGGLFSPVLRGVDAMTLGGVSAAASELVGRARAGKLRQQELEGGTFSVTNLGMFGTTEFSAIINPPQSGILAVGAATPQAVVRDGVLTIATVMRCTLSIDHRAIDGALAARWLSAFVRKIENPVSLLL